MRGAKKFAPRYFEGAEHRQGGGLQRCLMERNESA